MAFICDWCRYKLLDNTGHLKGFIRSRGVCELCNTIDICNDLAGYKCKPDWQEILNEKCERNPVSLEAGQRIIC